MAIEIHFLNVGHGDCTLIEHESERLTMIDINNSKSLPDLDEEALAEAKGLSVYQFKYGAISAIEKKPSTMHQMSTRATAPRFYQRVTTEPSG